MAHDDASKGTSVLADAQPERGSDQRIEAGRQPSACTLCRAEAFFGPGASARDGLVLGVVVSYRAPEAFRFTMCQAHRELVRALAKGIARAAPEIDAAMKGYF